MCFTTSHKLISAINPAMNESIDKVRVQTLRSSHLPEAPSLNTAALGTNPSARELLVNTSDYHFVLVLFLIGTGV
jgi:hypothetical protein